MLQRHLFPVLLGTALISHGSIVVIIAATGYRTDALPPLLEEGAYEVVTVQDPETGAESETRVSAVDPDHYVDPLPQALILTAIVISFGMLSFMMVLFARVKETSITLGASEYGDPDEEPGAS